MKWTLNTLTQLPCLLMAPGASGNASARLEQHGQGGPVYLGTWEPLGWGAKSHSSLCPGHAKHLPQVLPAQPEAWESPGGSSCRERHHQDLGFPRAAWVICGLLALPPGVLATAGAYC